MMNSEKESATEGPPGGGAAPQQYPRNYHHTHAHLHPHPQQQHQPQHQQQHQEQQQHQFMPAASAVGGGLMYNNLIPGHYRYGARPPAPPPGPLSYSQQQQHQHHRNFAQASYRNVPTPPPIESVNNINLPTVSAHQDQIVFDVVHISEPDDDFDDCEDDDDLSVVAIPSDLAADGQHENEDDDERYYRPFRHHQYDVASNESVNGNKSAHQKTKNGKKQKKMNISVDEREMAMTKKQKPVDLLAVLLLDNVGGGGDVSADISKNDDCSDIASLIREASTTSKLARSMTDALATKKRFKHNSNNNTVDVAVEGKKKSSEKVEAISIVDDDNNDLYAATSNVHSEAASSYRRVYRTLLGLPSSSTASSSPPHDEKVGIFGKRRNGTNIKHDSSVELAKSMLMLSDMHARTAKSFLNMGLKWNVDMTASVLRDGRDTRTITKKNESKDTSGKNPGVTTAIATSKFEGVDTTKSIGVSSSSSSSSTSVADDAGNHERLRMAVRKALDTANHEEDITNSIFLGVGGAHRSIASSSSPSKVTRSKNKMAVVAAASPAVGSRGRGRGGEQQNRADVDDRVNPVDDLMKLEKELRIMDAKLEMENSVANLGGGATTTSAYRPDGSFCVVPPGSSYMSSSSMWTSGIFLAGNAQQQFQQHTRQQARSKTNNANAQQQQHQQGVVGVRSRANHLQNFLGGGSHTKGEVSPSTAATIPPKSPQLQHPGGLQIVSPSNNVALDQSWWGVGGQGSILTSSANLSAAAIAATAAASSPPSSSSHQQHYTMHHQLSGRLNKVNPNNDADESDAIVAAARQKSTPSISSSSTTNAKQLMQLMDSLNRLGNENAQLMRMVEDAKGARAEAHAAREMMTTFKDEYIQRFEKVKEALRKFSNNNPATNGGGGVDNNNPVANSAFMKSATTLEIQKRDQMIKQLSNDLKKEREECKRKDSALQKYEAFYREVKARSAEKARQRQQQLEKEQQKQQEKRLP